MIRVAQFILAALLLGSINGEPGYAPITAPRLGVAMLDGIDPVSYRQVGGPVYGQAAFKARHDGQDVLFKDRANRARFLATPSRFLPAYGGACALALTQGVLIDGNPRIWLIVDGQLHLFYDHGTRSLFQLEQAANKALAERLWRERSRSDQAT